MRSRGLAAALLSAILSTSCAGTESTPPDKAAAEGASKAAKAECWRRASLLAEQEYARDRSVAETSYGRQIGLREDFDRFDANKRRDALYQRCVRELAGEADPAVKRAPATRSPSQ